MDIYHRRFVGIKIMYELQDGIHTFTMCKCNRHGCRTEKCWQCWLEYLIRGKIDKRFIKKPKINDKNKGTEPQKGGSKPVESHLK